MPIEISITLKPPLRRESLELVLSVMKPREQCPQCVEVQCESLPRPESLRENLGGGGGGVATVGERTPRSETRAKKS